MFQIHPRPCRSVTVPLIHPNPFTSIPTHSHRSDALHTHQSLQYSYQNLHTPLNPLTPMSGPPHPTKALHTYIRLSIPILGPLTIPWLSAPTKVPVPGSPHPPQTLHTYPKPSISPYTIQISSKSPYTSIHTHQRSSIPTKAFNTHLRPSIPN